MRCVSTTFSNKEPLILAYFRNGIYAISFPMRIRASMVEPAIVAPCYKIKSIFLIKKFYSSISFADKESNMC